MLQFQQPRPELYSMVRWLHRPFHVFPNAGRSSGIWISAGVTNIDWDSWGSMMFRLASCSHPPLCRLSKCSRWTFWTSLSSIRLLYLSTSPATTLSLFIKKTSTSTPYCEFKSTKCVLLSSHKLVIKLIPPPLQPPSGVPVFGSWSSIQPIVCKWKHDRSAQPDHCLYKPRPTGSEHTQRDKHTKITSIRSSGSVSGCWEIGLNRRKKVEKHDYFFQKGWLIVWTKKQADL